MRLTVILFFLLTNIIVTAQSVVPVVDFRGYFRNFNQGFFQQVEIQQIEEFKAGDNLVAYFDFRGNLIVYDGKNKKNVANLKVDYQVSDNLMAWKIGGTLNMWDSGVVKTLSFTNKYYSVKDNVIVFDDVQSNTLNVYFEGRVIPLFTSSVDLITPEVIGENIIAFKDNGNFNKVFWNGEIFDLDVWHSPYHFEAGTDVLCFNDPINGTFTVFENGEFLDVEEFHVGKYKAGRGFIVYENRNGDLMYYSQGKQKQLTNFGADENWMVKDDVAVWSENGFTYALENGIKYELSRYKPKEIIIKNDVVAFRDIMGGVSALVNGRIVEITTQMNSEFSIYGSTVLVELFNNSYIVYSNGRKYTL